MFWQYFEPIPRGGVVFPPRRLMGEENLRPPWFHCNFVSELMGLLQGAYDAKEGGGFVPSGASLHNCMSGLGPDAASFWPQHAKKARPPAAE
jgi:homogentisate 1,2-dioxygenase